MKGLQRKKPCFLWNYMPKRPGTAFISYSQTSWLRVGSGRLVDKVY